MSRQKFHCIWSEALLSSTNRKMLWVWNLDQPPVLYVAKIVLIFFVGETNCASLIGWHWVLLPRAVVTFCFGYSKRQWIMSWFPFQTPPNQTLHVRRWEERPHFLLNLFLQMGHVTGWLSPSVDWSWVVPIKWQVKFSGSNHFFILHTSLFLKKTIKTKRKELEENGTNLNVWIVDIITLCPCGLFFRLTCFCAYQRNHTWFSLHWNPPLVKVKLTLQFALWLPSPRMEKARPQ